MSGALASPNCYEFWNIRHYKHEKSDSQASKSRKEGSEKVKKAVPGREAQRQREQERVDAKDGEEDEEWGDEVVEVAVPANVLPTRAGTPSHVRRRGVLGRRRRGRAANAPPAAMAGCRARSTGTR